MYLLSVYFDRVSIESLDQIASNPPSWKHRAPLARRLAAAAAAAAGFIRRRGNRSKRACFPQPNTIRCLWDRPASTDGRGQTCIQAMRGALIGQAVVGYVGKKHNAGLDA